MKDYISLAKSTIEKYIKENKVISLPKNLPKKFYEKKAGVFITIKKDGKLRGCIGTFLATKENIAKEIIENSISAATKDYRFMPVEESELPFLSYEVYILQNPEKILSIESLNPKKYGILIKSKDKSGLLLPGLDGIENAQEQISIACQKADISSKEKIEIFRFLAKKFE